MSETPEWLKLLGVILPFVSTLVAYLLGSARRDGAERNTLAALSKEMQELRTARIDQVATLAAHTSLHAGYGAVFATLTHDLKKMGEDLAFIRGQMRPSRHNKDE